MLQIKSTVFFVFICLISLSIQCKSVDKSTIDAETVSTAKEEMYPIQPMVDKSSITRKMNADKSMELVLKRFIKVGDPASHFEYTVYDTATKEIIKKDSFRGEGVEWNDQSSLKLIPYVGMEQKPTSENPEEISQTKIQTQTQIIKLKG
ncbi:hypothetical protein GCM10022393_38280 [Aquimarina addita]|uniref:Lipoprotein n=1 Tax=Aquimarina addita TaxID=870485 RepID=A0ABP6UUP3_9FLAO